MAEIFTSIAVSPSGATLLNALQVTTAAGTVLNEGVCICDASVAANVCQVLASGAQLVEPGGVNSQPVTGTITANQATAANFNATVIGTVTANAGTGTLSTNIAQVLGSAVSKTNPLNVIPSDGTNQITAALSAWGVAPTGTFVEGINSNVFIAGTIAGTAASGVQKVGVVGNAGGAFDAATAASVPANAIAAGGKATIAANPVAVTQGQLVNVMTDKVGRLAVVQAHVRDQVGIQTTTIASSSAETTVVTNGAANIFNDITSLTITNASATAFNATLKDSTGGTTRAIYDIAANGGVVINFSPPLPQATAQNNWTITLSVSTITVHINIVYVKNI